MTCVTYFDKPDKSIADDKELSDLVSDASEATGRQFAIEKRTWFSRKWFRKVETHKYTLYLHVFASEWQIVNFGPPYRPWPEDRISFCYSVNRQVVAGFLFGVLARLNSTNPVEG